MSTAAYIPIVVFALGSKVVLKVAAVEMKFAHAKLSICQPRTKDTTVAQETHLTPVVTATCPSKLNQPVIHDASGACDGLLSIAAQKYGPPDVG